MVAGRLLGEEPRRELLGGLRGCPLEEILRSLGECPEGTLTEGPGGPGPGASEARLWRRLGDPEIEFEAFCRPWKSSFKLFADPMNRD